MKCLVLLLVLAACNVAMAADAPDPEKLKLARALLDSMHVDRQLDNATKVVGEAMAKSVATGDSKANPRVAQVMMEEAMAAAKESARGPGGFLDQMANFYATEFTADELRQIRAYYDSPAGQHMIEAQPKLMQQALPKIMEAMRARMPAVCELARARLIAEKVENAEKMCAGRAK